MDAQLAVWAFVFWALNLRAQFTYVTNGDNIILTGYSGPGGNVVISNFVTSIGDDAFEYSALTGITIPDSVADIGDDAFASCSTLANLALGNSIVSIGQRAFAFCTGLSNVVIPNSVNSIAAEAFESCTNVTEVAVPSSVTSIGGQAFFGCISLTNIAVNVNNFAYSSIHGVLFDKSQTTLIQFPPGLSGSYAIPNSVTSIGESAFAYGFNLTNVIIPNNLASIGSDAFSYCSSLTGVLFTGNAPIADSSVFQGDSQVVAYYLPGTTGWGAFTTNTAVQAVLWNPAIQSSGPNFGVHGNGFGFTITGTPDIPIVVQATADLTSGSWQPLQSCALTNGSIYFSDSNWMNYPNRFYSITFP